MYIAQLEKKLDSSHETAPLFLYNTLKTTTYPLWFLFVHFSSLVTRANKWLRENGHVRVKVCESIEVKGRYDGIVDTNKSSYFEGDHIKKKMRNMYIRALR